MKKKLALLIALVMSLTSVAYAGSYNYISSEQHVKDGASLAGETLYIEPHSEVETGSSIVVKFHNAVVFSQDVLDGASSGAGKKGWKSGGYQYKVNGSNWNASQSFYSVMKDNPTLELPYYIRKINDEEMEIFLCNVPDIYAGGSMSNVNGINRAPYYSIPLTAYADGKGVVTIDIDSNGTAISSSSNIESNSNVKSTTTTETTTEITTEEVSEITTEESNIKSVEVQVGSDIMKVGNAEVKIDTTPYIQESSSSTMIPMRAVVEALSSDENSVQWDTNTKTVTVKYNEKEIKFTIGSNLITVGSSTKAMPYGAVPEITNSRTFIPFRALGEALGVEVSWYAENKIAKFN